MRWREECLLTGYEMEWTVRYFLYKHQYWTSAHSADGRPLSSGAACYANRKAAMWRDLALYADKAFKSANNNYKSPM